MSYFNPLLLSISVIFLAMAIAKRDRAETVLSLGLVCGAAWWIWSPMVWVGLFLVVAGLVMQRRDAQPGKFFPWGSTGKEE